MKTKLLKKLRKWAKEYITIECKITKDGTTYTVYKDGWSSSQSKSKDEAIDYLSKIRREYILKKLNSLKEEKQNKELSKI